MSARGAVFIAASLDGYIARLEAAQAGVPAGEDCGYGAFLQGIDGLVMGRRTFEQVLGFPDWPFARRRVVVMSRRGVVVPEALRGSVSVSADAPTALFAQLGAQGLGRVYVDGGLTIQACLRAGLIDELTVTTIPVLLGSGRTLFGPLAGDVGLERLSTVAYDFGFVQSRYRVRPAAAA